LSILKIKKDTLPMPGKVKKNGSGIYVHRILETAIEVYGLLVWVEVY